LRPEQLAGFANNFLGFLFQIGGIVGVIRGVSEWEDGAVAALYYVVEAFGFLP
jgi:hypothetical protein